MRIEIDIEPEQVGVILDALTDYAERATFEAGSSALDSTGPNPTLTFLARGVAHTAAVLVAQLEPYADAIPAVGQGRLLDRFMALAEGPR